MSESREIATTGTHAHYYLSRGEDPRGCLVLRDDAGTVQYLFKDGSVLECQPDEAPVAATGDPLSPAGWQTFVTVQGQWQTWRYDPQRQTWTGTVQVTVPDEDVRSLVESDWDHPDATVGDEEDHCYINVAEGPGGYYVTVSLDCNTGGFTHTLADDDGPYENYEEALAAGKSASEEWCLDNDVYVDDAHLEGMGVGSHIWVKPHRRAQDEGIRATVLAWDQENRGATLRFEDGHEEDVSFDLIRGIDYDEEPEPRKEQRR